MQAIGDKFDYDVGNDASNTPVSNVVGGRHDNECDECWPSLGQVLPGNLQPQLDACWHIHVRR